VHDRVDIVRHVLPPSSGPGRLPGEEPERSVEVRARVADARRRQRQRYAGRDWRLNSAVPSATLAQEWPLPRSARLRLESDLFEGRLSRRGAVRVHRLAWTVADLRGSEFPDESDVDTALRLRSGEALRVQAIERAS